MAFQRGDVVLLPFPFSTRSSTKIRPAVVVSGSDYERVSGNIIVALVTSKIHDSRYDYRLEDWAEARLIHPSTVRAKLTTLSPRLVRYCPGQLSERDRVGVYRVLLDVFKFPSFPTD
jgi:mRNA interferase MazF